MVKQYLVLGLGAFGEILAKELVNLGAQVTVVDSDKEKINVISSFVTQAVEADATDERILKSLDVATFDAVIVAIGEDLEASISLTHLLKELGAKRVIVKVLNEKHAKIALKIGADRVILPEKEVAEKLAEQLTTPSVLDRIKLSPEHEILEIKAPKRFVGKTLEQLNLRQKFHVTIVAINRKKPFIRDDGITDINEELIAPVDSKTEIQEGDSLLVVGKMPDIEKLKEL